jgi:hypothetical protein
MAGINKLGVTGPTLPSIYAGLTTPHASRPYVPCLLLKAVGWVESNGWQQFNAPYGQFGLTVIAPDCGYGIMQITSGMSGGAGFDPYSVASSPTYNIGTGAKFLIEKWNSSIPPIGDNNPNIVEEWYYATWAYNGFSFINNPNNTAYSPNRTLWTCTYTNQNAGLWPYQEKVWGCMMFPPLDPLSTGTLWNAVSATLPNKTIVGNPPQTISTVPQPIHQSCSMVFLPLIQR